MAELATAGSTTSSVDAPGDDIELVLFVLADGARPDVLRALSAAGELPNIARYLLADGSIHDGVTVLPSVTDVAYLPILCGQYPGTANIPGLRWIDKARFGSGSLRLKGHRTYIGPAHSRLNEDLADGVETLFELCSGSLAVRTSVDRGLSPGHSRFGLTAMPFMLLSHYLKRSDFVDRLAFKALLRAFRHLERGSPSFAFIPLLDVDTASHAHGPEHRRTMSAYRRIDEIVGEIVDWLKRDGMWQRTHMMMSSDHGHTETKDHLDLRGLLSDIGYRVFEHPNFYIRKADAAVMVSGNSLANVYVTSEGAWRKPLTDTEIEDQHPRMLASLRQRDEIDWFAYRSHGGGVTICSSDGIGVLGMEGDSYTYEFDGVDPLRAGLMHNSIPRDDALCLTAETDFPDALEQVWQLFTSHRTGDVVVTAKPGYDLRGWREVPEHHSSHGALCRDQMRVPVLSSRPLAAEGPVRTVDLFPTITNALSLAPTKPHLGNSLW